MDGNSALSPSAALRSKLACVKEKVYEIIGEIEDATGTLVPPNTDSMFSKPESKVNRGGILLKLNDLEGEFVDDLYLRLGYVMNEVAHWKSLKPDVNEIEALSRLFVCYTLKKSLGLTM